MSNRSASPSTQVRRGQLGTSVVALAVAAVISTGMQVSAQAATPSPSRDLTASDHSPTRVPGAVNGKEAVARLGSSLGRVAAREGMSATALRSLLRRDKTLWVGSDDNLMWAEKLPLSSDEESAPPAVAASAVDVFSLHSNPGASKVIFLDFDGATNTNQDWTNAGVPAQLRGFDPDNDGPSFSEGERATIEQVWQVVADRFSPWDVDVTTADPGPDGLTRSDEADTTYGVQVIYTSPGTPDIGQMYGVNGVTTSGFADTSAPARAYVFPHDG